MERKRIVYADLLKLVAMLAVIVIHLCTPGWKAGSVTPGWAALNFYNALTHFAVPVFLMVSGVFFLDNERPLPFARLWGKYLLRLLTAYVFWSAAYAVTEYLTGEATLTDMVKQFIAGHYHLWYVYVVAMLYMIAPLLRRFTASRRLCLYFLGLSFLFTVAFPAVGKVFAPAGTLTGYFYMNFVTGYVFFFVAGWYLHHWGISRRVRMVLYALGVIGAAVTVWLGRRQDAMWFDAFAPGMALMCLAVFTAFRYGVSRIRWSDRAVNRIAALAGCTFGVYLMHDFCLMALTGLGWLPATAGAVWKVPVTALAVAAVCFPVTLLLRRIPGVNRWLV